MPSRTDRETRALITRALCEVIDSIVAPRVREIVLDQAIASTAASCLPTEPEQFEHFVHGPLRDSLIRAVGSDCVDAVDDDLQRIVQRIVGPTRERSDVAVESGRRRSYTPSSRPRFQAVRPTRTTPAPRARSAPPRPCFRSAPTPRFPSSHAPPRAEPSAPPISSGPFPRDAAKTLSMAGVHPPLAPAASPLLVIASQQLDLPRRLSQSLAAHVDVITIHNLLQLVREVSSNSDCRVVVLIDCRAPSVRPVAVAALAEDLPSNVHVVLWGASAELQDRLNAMSPRCQTWISIAPDTDLDVVAGRCSMLAG